MSGFADHSDKNSKGYSAILDQMSGFRHRPDIYRIFVDNDFVSGYLSDIRRKNTGHFQPCMTNRIFANP